jgi:putative transposase
MDEIFGKHRIANARPLRALPSPITEPDSDAGLHVRRRDRLGGILREYQNAA